MKLRKRILSFILVFVFILSLTACGDSKIVGTWSAVENGIESTYVFNNDGTGSLTILGIPIDLKYTTNDNSIEITASMLGSETVVNGIYSIDGPKLTLTIDDQTTIFTKIK